MGLVRSPLDYVAKEDNQRRSGAHHKEVEMTSPARKKWTRTNERIVSKVPTMP